MYTWNQKGSLTASASVGPGVLKDTEVEVTWNPEDESATRVTGGARFVVPAEAGLRMAITGALGAGIPVVSASAGLELGGTLGVKGEASAGATLEWTPSGGVNMEADVKVEAQPTFTFDLTGFVDVSADLVLDTVELYSKRWKLASVEYGSDMKVGAKLAVTVENSEVKPISVDDIEFIPHLRASVSVHESMCACECACARAHREFGACSSHFPTCGWTKYCSIRSGKVKLYQIFKRIHSSHDSTECSDKHSKNERALFHRLMPSK